MSFRIRLTKLLASVRAPIFLLGAMLLATLVVSGFTLQLLSAHRTQLDEALRASRAQALDLLASRVEHAILGSLRPPFQVLGGSAAEASPERLALVGASFPEVEQIWLWDGSGHLRAGWSRLESDQRPADEQWLARRLRSVITELHGKSPAISTFVEKLDNEPALFAVERMNDQNASGHWAVIQFDFATLRERSVTPLLNELAAARGGRIELQDPEAEWDDNALHEPLTRALPGWLLSYWPDPKGQDTAHGRDEALLLGVSSGAVLALLLATYAVWRELRRERSLVELRNRFVANVSHELKTPLALIRMYAETLSLGRIRDEARRQTYYATIVRESERLSEMINSVLDLERLRQGRALYTLTATDLAATVRDVLERYRDTLSERGASFELDLGVDLPPVAHDPRGVTQILLNLLNNARDHGGQGPIDVYLMADGDRVDLAVTDRGTGLTAEELQRIRRALRRRELAESRRGSGLGLALVKQIAAAHCAYFVLDNAGDEGGLRAVVSFSAASGEHSIPFESSRG